MTRRKNVSVKFLFLAALCGLGLMGGCAGRGGEPGVNFSETSPLASLPKPENKNVKNEGDKNTDSPLSPGQETRPDPLIESAASGLQKSIATGEIQVRLSGRHLAPLPIESMVTVTLAGPEIQGVQLTATKLNGHKIADESIRFASARLDQKKSNSRTLVFQAEFTLQMAKEDLARLLSDPDLKSVFEELTTSMEVVVGSLSAHFKIDRSHRKGQVDFSILIDSPLARDVSLQIEGTLRGRIGIPSLSNGNPETRSGPKSEDPPVEETRTEEPASPDLPASDEPPPQPLAPPDPKTFFDFDCDTRSLVSEFTQHLPLWSGKSGELVFDTQKPLLNSDFRFLQDIEFPPADGSDALVISQIKPFILPADGSEPKPFDVTIKKERYPSDCFIIDSRSLRVLFSSIRIGLGEGIEFDLVVRGYFPILPDGTLHLFSPEENQNGFFNIMAILSNVNGDGSLANSKEVPGLRVQLTEAPIIVPLNN
jgi:hypothetical protein